MNRLVTLRPEEAVAPAPRVARRYREELSPNDAPAMEVSMLVGRVYGTWINLITPFLATFGLTPSRFSVLRLLYHAPDKRLTMSEIRKGLSVTSTNVTRLIDGLEEEGWVHRENHPNDRRVVFTALSPEGETRFAELLPRTVEKVERMSAGLAGDEKQELARLLGKLRNSMVSSGSSYMTPREPRLSRPMR